MLFSDYTPRSNCVWKRYTIQHYLPACDPCSITPNSKLGECHTLLYVVRPLVVTQDSGIRSSFSFSMSDRIDSLRHSCFKAPNHKCNRNTVGSKPLMMIRSNREHGTLAVARQPRHVGGVRTVPDKMEADYGMFGYFVL